MYDQIIQNAINIDNILFPLEILLVFYLSRYVNGINSKILIIVYGLISISSYNIFIEYIKDYGVVIPRTFLFKYQVLGSLNYLDIFSIIFLVFLNYRVIYSIVDSGIAKLYFFKSFTILLISLLAVVIYYTNGGLIDWRFHFSQYRGIFLSLLFFYIFNNSKKDISNFDDLMRLFKLLIIIDFINILSEIILAPYFEHYLWGRGGHPVTTLDQSNSILAMSYLPVIFIGKRLGWLYLLFGYSIIGISLYDYIKSFYIILPTFILLFLFINYFNKKIKFSTILIASIVFLLSSLFILPTILKDNSVATTRSIQINSYIKTIQESPISILIGTGYGSKYEVLSNEQDYGAINKIDRDLESNFQSEFQVPFLWYFKSTGILGILIVITCFCLSICYVTKLNLISVYSSAQLLVISLASLLDDLILSPDPNSSIYISKMIFFSYMFSNQKDKSI